MIAIPQAGRPGFRRTFSRDVWAVGLLLAWALAGEAGAEETAESRAAASQSRSSAAERTAALLAKLPKFTPAPPPREPGAASPDEDVLVLPKLTVRAKLNLPDSDYTMLNAKGRLELSLEKHPGLKIGDLLGLNDNLARTMQQDERLAAKKAELSARVETVAFSDSELDQKIRGLTKSLQQRSGAERDFPSVYLPPRKSKRRD